MTVMDMPTNGQAIARRVNYQPLAPVGNASALKTLLEVQRDSIAQALPRHVTPERLIKTLLVAANRTPDLLQCTQASVIETINRAAELGLDLSGTTGEAYPVPFNNNIGTRDNPRWVKQCQLIIGYRGLAKLARQSGEIKRIDADVVYANDEFEFRKGSDACCRFTPNLKGDRGEVVGVYAYVQFKDGGEQFDFMPVPDVEKVRRRSKSGSDRNGNAIGAWKTDWEEMAKKTIFRRVAKWLPLSTEKFVKAIETDGQDFDLAEVVGAAVGKSAGERLQAKLTQRPVSEGQSFEPDPAALAEAEQSEDPGEAAPEPQDPDTSGVEAEPPTDPAAPQQEAAARPTHAEWVESCIAIGAEVGMTRPFVEGGMTRFLKKIGKIADKESVIDEQRQAAEEAIHTKSGFWAM